MLIIALPATRSWPKHLVHWQHTTTLIVAIATPLLQPPRRTEQRQPMAAVPKLVPLATVTFQGYLVIKMWA